MLWKHVPLWYNTSCTLFNNDVLIEEVLCRQMKWEINKNYEYIKILNERVVIYFKALCWNLPEQLNKITGKVSVI
jgi:hypothetical protein